MSRLITSSTCLVCLLLGCSNNPRPHAEPAPVATKAAPTAAPGPAPEDIEPTPEEIPVPEDFAAEAALRINASNYKAELDAIQREISAEN